MLRQLKADYQDENVVFIEQNVDSSTGDRLGRWLSAYTAPGDIYLPLVMVDSGNQISNDDVDFSVVYADMVDTSLDRPAKARMAVDEERIGDLLLFDVRLTNTCGETLSAANHATLTALVYLEPSNSADIPIALRAENVSVTTLEDGDTGDFTFEVVVNGLDSARTRWIVIADYLPSGSTGAFDTLQAVVGP